MSQDMPVTARSTHGRLATLLVLGALLLTVSAAIYVFVARHEGGLSSAATVAAQSEGEQATPPARRLATLLTIVLVSALLILLFAVGAYLVVRVGQFIARQRVGGAVTPYVDAWSQYRLSEADISAATDEQHPPNTQDGGPASPPTEPPPDTDTPGAGS